MRLLGFRVAALAVVNLADVALLVDQVVRGPEALVPRIPRGELVVDRDRVVDAVPRGGVLDV